MTTPYGIAYTGDGTKLYICDEDNNGVRGFDATTLSPLSPALITNGNLALAIAFPLLLAPQPASGLIGRIEKNRFLTQTDRINSLRWTASLSTNVARYEVKRNGELIATLVGGYPAYFYQDHNRRKGVLDTYTVVAVDVNGGESTPISLTLP